MEGCFTIFLLICCKDPKKWSKEGKNEQCSKANREIEAKGKKEGEKNIEKTKFVKGKREFGFSFFVCVFSLFLRTFPLFPFNNPFTKPTKLKGRCRTKVFVRKNCFCAFALTNWCGHTYKQTYKITFLVYIWDFFT